MKAKYQHYGNDCIIYDQVICEDNIVVKVKYYHGPSGISDPEAKTTVHLTNAEARSVFWHTCQRLEKEGCECIYKEAT
jgi:hypothetical protein